MFVCWPPYWTWRSCFSNFPMRCLRLLAGSTPSKRRCSLRLRVPGPCPCWAEQCPPLRILSGTSDYVYSATLPYLHPLRLALKLRWRIVSWLPLAGGSRPPRSLRLRTSSGHQRAAQRRRRAYRARQDVYTGRSCLSLYVDGTHNYRPPSPAHIVLVEDLTYPYLNLQ